jgi:lipopolysaccharide export system permease protein
VLVFIVFYILDNTGTKMARDDNWTVWFGKWLGTAVLTPIACFFTYKANNDSVVFNIDLYKNMLTRMLGLRTKRYIVRKEVIIEDPKYLTDAEILTNISLEISDYMQRHKLLRWPNPIRVFFRPGDDNDIEQINSAMEVAIEDLSYSKNNYVLMKLNQYPIIATHAHTRPFRRKWLNAITGLFLPTGIFFYIRMLRFRFRLYRDLQHIIRNNEKLIPRIIQLGNLQKEGSVTII